MAEDRLGTLRFIGDRFTESGLMFELGVELAAFQKIVDVVARSLYRADNPGRERVPSGFPDRNRLFTSDITDGSTVIEYREAAEEQQMGLFDALGSKPPLSYAGRALEVIADAYDNPDQLPEAFPPQAKKLLLRFGATLEGPEVVEMECSSRPKKVRYGVSERSRLNNSIRSFTESEEQLIGRVINIDVDTSTFQISVEQSSEKLGGRYSPDDWHDLLKAELEPGTKSNRILLEAVVRRGGEKPPKIIQVNDVYVVEKQMEGYDVAAKTLDELETANGTDNVVLHRTRQLLNALRYTSLRSPMIFPLDDGGVHLEWQVGTEPTYIDFESDGSIDAVAAIPGKPMYREFEDVEEVIAFVRGELDQHLDTDTPPAVTI